MNDWISHVLAHPELCDMIHLQRPEDNNLGLSRNGSKRGL